VGPLPVVDIRQDGAVTSADPYEVTGPDQRLATYGTLMPGRENHQQLEGLAGRWRAGQVRGRLVEAGWGAARGFPALVLDPQGAVVPVAVLESADLTAHWGRLDAFEGVEYERVVTAVWTEDGSLAASIYVLAPHAHPRREGAT
jgi:gamma-glutamylcyclotransferase (GGCT)/AIG2-like uncharacterized protein YtfP